MSAGADVVSLEARVSWTRLLSMNPSEILRANLPLIEQITGRVCRRSRLFGADAEDFASVVKLALIEEDYALLRDAAQRSSLRAYLTVVIQRLAVDERMRAFGRFQASAEARRLGEAGILAEILLLRDRRTIDEALPLVRAIDPAMTRERLAEIADRLPLRTGRPRPVDLESGDAGDLPAPQSADEHTRTRELERLAGRTSQAMRDALDSFPIEDRAIIRLRFGSAMAVSDISRMLRLPQRPLYRRLESLLARLRSALGDAGLDSAAVSELIGSATAQIHFGLAEETPGEAFPAEERA